MLFNLILFILFIFNNIIIISSMYTQTFDKGYTEISDELKGEIEALYQSKIDRIGFPVIININTDTISADQDLSVNLKLPYKSGDLGTDIMELLYVKKEGELFSIKNYNITYFLNEENVIHTIYPNMFPDDIENTIENDIDCNYTILNNTYNLEIQKFPKLKKIIFYSYVILGLEFKSNLIKRIGYRDSSLYQSDISDRVFKGAEYFNDFTQDTIFLDIFKIEQLFFKKGYIVFLVKHKKDNNQWDYLLLFYEIFLINEEFSLDIENVININDIFKDVIINNQNYFLENLKIEKVGYYGNYKFILFINKNKDNDLIIYDSLKNTTFNFEEILKENANDTFLRNKNIADFIIFSNELCLLIEDEGLFAFMMNIDINDLKINFEFHTYFEFKYGKKLEIYKNPFYGSVFIGVLFDKDINKKGNEIYMELLVDGFFKKHNNSEEIILRINKIATASDKRNFKHLQFMDSFYNFFYDDINKELFIYRIGLLNSIPYVTYKLNLINDKNNAKIIKDINISNIVPIYNKDDGKFNILLIGNENYIVLNNLVLASHNLNCTFHACGNFNLSFILKGEVCAHSLQKAKEGIYSSCHKLIKYNFHIYGKDRKNFALFLIFLLCMILLSLILFGCFSINTNCFRNYKKIKSIPLNKSLYDTQRINMITSGFNTIDNLQKDLKEKKN